MLPKKNLFAFDRFLIILIYLSSVSIINPGGNQIVAEEIKDFKGLDFVNEDSIDYDVDSINITQSSLTSSTFIYYETTQNDLVDSIVNSSGKPDNLPTTFNPQQLPDTTSSGFVPENSKTTDYTETIKLDNGNQNELTIYQVDLLTTVKPDIDNQLTYQFEDLIAEDFAPETTKDTIEINPEQSTNYQTIGQPEVLITENTNSPVDDQTIKTTIFDDYLTSTTTIFTQAETINSNPDGTELPSTTTPQPIIDPLVTQPSNSIVTDFPEVKTTQSSEIIIITTDQEITSTTTEKVNSESTDLNSFLNPDLTTFKPSMTTVVDDIETIQSTIDIMPTTTESNLTPPTQEQSTLLPIESTTLTSKSDEPTTHETITETPQFTEEYPITSTITTITNTDWVQSTTSNSKSDDITVTITSQLPSSAATESTTIESIQSTLQTQSDPQTGPQTTTTIATVIETTTHSVEQQTTPESSTTTFKSETTQNIDPQTASQTTIVIETTAHSVEQQTTPESSTTFKSETAQNTDPQNEPQPVTLSTVQTTIKTDDATSEPNVSDPLPIVNQISCDCSKTNFDEKPHCRFTCDSSILANVHINLTFFGLKIAMILSNRDYVICIAIGLGFLLLISGFVLRLIHNRRRRKLIAQRNYDILYQDFGTINEKNKQWLVDFSYQSSIL